MDLSLQLDDEDAARLRKRAEVEGVTEQTLALTALRRFLDAGAPATPAASPISEVKRRYASSLKRRGE